MTGKITTFLFDIGNVLVRWNPDPLINDLMTRHNISDRYTVENCFRRWQPFWDKSTMANLLDKVAREEPEYAEFTADFARRIPEALAPVFEENVCILKRLKEKGNRLYTASNFAADILEKMRPDFTFLEYFDGIYISGEAGFIKPDPEFFVELLKRYDISAKESVFIDDLKENVEAAESLGIKGIVCRDPENLETEMKEFLA